MVKPITKRITIVTRRALPVVCDRCKEHRECRDVLGTGSKVCFSCVTREELDAYGVRVFGPRRTA
jgi:formylmethanofuran dehydrogenase subunit E